MGGYKVEFFMTLMEEDGMLEYSFDRPISIPGLRALLRQTTWANARLETDIAESVANTPVQLGVWDGEKLVAYARVITDGRFRALIDDVVVDQSLRGAGIGTEIMKRLLERLSSVEGVFLLTSDENARYYARFGFKPTAANCLSWKDRD
ncbi:MAG TPA: GNAT family N-acetyltransferase [Devosiaceae bacterium]|jgi:predicted N-acetyltransferase YhbS|nr:GNAT family N-acetyltransferase [Devosiaceae bacterium]